MAGFDIATLAEIKPARWLCVKCNALLRRPPGRRCDACKVIYGGGDDDEGLTRDFLTAAGRRLDYPQLMTHAAYLANAVRPLRDNDLEVPPLRVLFDVLLAAREFVHFISYGMTWDLLGVLAVVARRVPVIGVVNNTNESTMEVADSLRAASPWLNVRRYPAKSRWDGPHQKMLIIDGLLVLKGSANLTLNSWLEAASGHNELDVVTDIDRVIGLNNRYFAPQWAKLGGVADSIIDCRLPGVEWRYPLRQPDGEPPPGTFPVMAPEIPLDGWIWSEIIERMESASRVTAAFLSHTRGALCRGVLNVKFPSHRRFEMEALMKDGRQQQLLEVAQAVIGHSVEKIGAEVHDTPAPRGPFDDEPPF
jgi:hypothetical protein